MRQILTVIPALCFSLFASCATIPEGATAVEGFDGERYLGKWYEIARFDFRFERNLDNTTAEYSLNSDGTIRVVNRGRDYIKNEWKEAVGKARFQGEKSIGALKVSFFGPFYSAYNVIALDSDYQYALVAGKNLSYLWILSREKTLGEKEKTALLSQAKALGFHVENLIWVSHNN